ncbi:MAG: M56 family metallopeptidase [Acidobacteriota bacterium]
MSAWVLTYALNAAWQAPVIFAAAWVAAQILRRTGPIVVHRLWVGAMVAQVVLPACSGSLPASLHELLESWLASGGAGSGHVTVVMSPGIAMGGLHLSQGGLTAAVTAYALAVLFFAARLAWGLRSTFGVGRRAAEMQLDEATELRWRELTWDFGVRRVLLAESPEIGSPLTMGLRRPLVLVPQGMLEGLPDEERDVLFAHELAHVARKDFGWNLLAEVLMLPLAMHPVVRFTRGQVAATRELVCDQMAAAVLAGPQAYARSLLRLASRLAGGGAAPVVHAIGIFDANRLEERVMRLMQKRVGLNGVRRAVLLAAAGVLAVGTCAAAMTLHVNVAAQEAPAAGGGHEPEVAAHVMAGQIVSKVTPAYPVEAKEHKIQGAVVMHAVIDTDGSVKELYVVSGPKELRLSALAAVKQWIYKPYLLNGNPTAVTTEITVNYSLAN